MADLRCTPDVRFDELTEAGLLMLSTLRVLAKPLPFDTLWVTAAANGVHSGPTDPHYRGLAFDVRTHLFPTRAARFKFCDQLTAALGPQFFAFVEDPDAPNEHIHVQVAKGHAYVAPVTTAAPSRNAL